MPQADPLGLRRRIVRSLEEAVGRHDDPKIYGGPTGDPGLTGPDSVSWRLHRDMGTIAVAGAAAIVMEILHPAVMAGVYAHSAYRTQTFQRARATFGYVMVTTFGSTAAAERTITAVRRRHEQVNGTAPDGRPYRAMDPTLLGWVHTAIPWAIMLAYERYNGALTDAEKDRYLAEQAVIGRSSGAGDIPVTVRQLDEYVEAMRPQLAVTEQTREFIDFLIAPAADPSEVSALERFTRRLSLHASMRLMPPWAQRLTGLVHSDLAQRLWFEPSTALNARLIRWACETPPCVRLAEARVAGAGVAHATAA